MKQLVEVLINSIYDKGEAIDAKLMVYKVSVENRHLLRFFKR